MHEYRWILSQVEYYIAQGCESSWYSVRTYNYDSMVDFDVSGGVMIWSDIALVQLFGNVAHWI
jgi:hypothetical protein